jgi:N-acetylmuramic acid 6-phosphate etherase
MAFRSKWQALPTEAINPSSLGIDKLEADQIVDLMINEDRKMLAAVQRERERIAVGVEMVASALRRGGRIVFVGAGTSGRLGILESAEMPLTFSTDPSLVQAIIAGGRDAVFGAKEGVEDHYEEGARAITRIKPGKKDVVVGVSASGMTPFVRGALTRARKAGARVVFVTCDPGTELQTFVDLTIAPGVGAEVIAGSTRLKAGTATKLVLNMLTTGAMVLIGKTYGNLMVDTHTSSEKLKDRARRIVNIVTGLDLDDTDRLLAKARWNVKAAIVMQKTGLPLTKALARLRKANDSMREAIGEDIEPRLRGMLQGHAEAASVVVEPPVAPRTPRAPRAPRIRKTLP